MKQSKVYDREFKENIVKLSYERDNMSQFARELGISVKQVYSWPIQDQGLREFYLFAM